MFIEILRWCGEINMPVIVNVKHILALELPREETRWMGHTKLCGFVVIAEMSRGSYPAFFTDKKIASNYHEKIKKLLVPTAIPDEIQQLHREAVLGELKFNDSVWGEK